ncbi:MAG: bifunctional oligoribonuclease/PAP phosphatase NrnA [Clostridia bacterium]|nr:bifunctional oligoribonuclease/PAP phosphatase NrnA [Clostridia bacterium]
MKISLEKTAHILKNADNIAILIHHFPDGDTIGCGYSLCRALQNQGKNVRVECADKVGDQYGYITENFKFDQFKPDFVVAVDVAAKSLLGDLKEKYPKIDLCIDHHSTNEFYAENTYVDSKSAAACEIVYELCKMLDGIDLVQASALYTGISTDTGCFKFSNTTAKTHRIAADLMDMGVDYAEINRIMFDTKSKARMQVEKDALNSIKFLCDNKVAIMTITKESRLSSGAKDSELEGITGLPRTIEGVILGITIRERDDTNIWKISARSNPPVSASEFCARFGGGGHERAAGCEIKEPKENALKILSESAEKMFKELGLN